MSDIDGDRYETAIRYLFDRGIVSGYADNTYQSFWFVNRAEFTKIIVGAELGFEPTSFTRGCFSDVPALSPPLWFESWVCHAKDQLILGGYDDGTFKPERNIPVSDSAKIIANTFDIPLAEVGPGAAWYETFIGASQNRNYIPPTLEAENQLVTRGEMAEWIYRVLEDIQDLPSTNLIITPPSGSESSGLPENSVVLPSLPEPVLGGQFYIGLFSQPVEVLQQWDGIINMAYEYPQGTDVAAWDDAAAEMGLVRFRFPMPGESELPDDVFIANIDEAGIPQNDSSCIVNGGLPCRELAIQLSADWASRFSGTEQAINLAGPNVLASCDSCDGPTDQGCHEDNTQCYPSLIGTQTYLMGLDVYPCTGWLPSLYQSRRCDVRILSEALEKLKGWMRADQELFAIIESSHQRLGGEAGFRGPTAAEVRAQMWETIRQGGRMIAFFPIAFNPFEFDATPEDVKQEIATQSEMIYSLAFALQMPVDPADINVVSSHPDVEVGWRIADDPNTGIRNAYIMALNLSENQVNDFTLLLTGLEGATGAQVVNKNRSVPIGGNQLLDNLGPHDVNVYVVSLSD